MYLPKESSFILIAILLSLSSCNGPEPYAKISVSETKGLTRNLEYVSVEIPLSEEIQPSQMLVATDREKKSSVPVQVLDTVSKEGNTILKILFPVNVEANKTKTFELFAVEKMRDSGPNGIQISEDGLFVENQKYKATFCREDDQRGGQINGIILKNFEDRLLKRGHIAMHWAPNFSKSEEEAYFNMEDLPQNSEHHIKKGLYQVTKFRSGRTDEVPEIFVEGKYNFFAALPYFIFESTMKMEEDVSLNLLRNDEMTMDSLFTHVVYQKKDGTVSRLKLYEQELDSLENNHIPDNTGFVAFYNADHRYGMASIRLEYDNTNNEGNQSALLNPYTKISKSSGNGRYWNRVLIDSATNVSTGSRYHEKNAYLVFEVGQEIPEEEILYYAERLSNPLTVTVTSQD